LQAGRKQIGAGVVGNILQWYDFAIYGYLAPILSLVFFDNGKNTGLLLTFSVFAIGFLARPLGALIFSHFGDRIGRRRILNITIIAMAVPTILIAVLPTYQQIGLWAPLLLVVLRLAQGLAIAGEIGGSLAYLLEHSQAKRRAMAAALVAASIAGAMLLGSLVSLILTSVISTSALYAWGWRIPFALSLPMSFIFWAMRRSMQETPEFTQISQHHELAQYPLGTILSKHWQQTLAAFGVYSLLSVGFYIISVYLPTFFAHLAGLGHQGAFFISFLGMFLLVGFILLAGGLADIIGAHRLLIIASIALGLTAFPVFKFLFMSGVVSRIILGEMILVLAYAGVIASTFAYVGTGFPTRVRYAGISLVDNTSNTVLGGTAPLVAAALVQVTGQSIAPSFYLVICSIVTLLCIPLLACNSQPRVKLSFEY